MSGTVRDAETPKKDLKFVTTSLLNCSEVLKLIIDGENER